MNVQKMPEDGHEPHEPTGTFVSDGEQQLKFDAKDGMVSIIRVTLVAYGTGAGCFLCEGTQPQADADLRIEAHHWTDRSQVNTSFKYYLHPNFSLYVGGHGMSYDATKIGEIEAGYTVSPTTLGGSPSPLPEEPWTVRFHQPTKLRVCTAEADPTAPGRWVAAETEPVRVKQGEWIEQWVGAWQVVPGTRHP